MDFKGSGQNNNMGVPNQGIPYQQMPNSGLYNQGQPIQGQPMQGQPMQGQPMQGQPMQGRPMQGQPMQGQPMQGQPMQGRPIQGQPMQGQPMQRQPVQGQPMQGRMPYGQTPNQQMQGQGQPIQGQSMQNRGMYGRTANDEASMRLASGIEKSVRNSGNNAGERGKARLFDNDDKNTGTDNRQGHKSFAGIMSGFSGLSMPKGVVEGIAGFSGLIYAGILVICLSIALIAYGVGHHGGGGGKTYNIPTDMFTYTGVIRDAYEAALSGSLSGAGDNADVMYNEDGTQVPPAPTAVGDEVPSATDAASAAEGDSATDDGALPEGGSSDFSTAESYKELLTQLESAIASGDAAFVASKMAYEDDSGTLKAYPQTVIDHFVTYMSANPDKRQALMTDLDNDKYSGQNEGTYIVKMPYMKFVVNMGYDNTTVSIPGFADQVVNAGQSADIAPLLPCMYTLTISNPDWNDVVTRDIEASINEAAIAINIKP